MRNALAHHREISGVETSRCILGQREKCALVFTDFHSLCSLSAPSCVFYSCHLPPYISELKSLFYLVFLSDALVYFPAPFLFCSFSFGCCFLTMFFWIWRIKTPKVGGEGSVGKGSTLIRNLPLWQRYLVNSLHR